MTSPLDLLRRYQACYRGFGAEETLGRALRSLRVLSQYRSLDIFIKEISRLNEKPPDEDPSLVCQEVARGELPELSLTEGLPSKDELRGHFAHGSRMFAAFKPEGVVAVTWINAHHADLTHIRRPQVRCARGVLYAHGTFVAPRYQNRVIWSALRRTYLGVVKKEGFETVWAAAYLRDPRLAHWYFANGFRKWGRMVYVRIIGKDFWLNRLTPDGARYPELLNDNEPTPA